MRTTLWTGPLFVASLLLAAACTQQGTTSSTADTEYAPQGMTTAAPDTVRESRLDGFYVTARGRGLRLEIAATPESIGFESADTLQRFAPDPEALLSRTSDRIGLGVSVDEGEWSRFSMATDPAHEGTLFRIHVDRPEGMEDCRYKAIAIGYYSEMWSEDAVERQRTKCIPCGEILVCGVNPTCP